MAMTLKSAAVALYEAHKNAKPIPPIAAAMNKPSPDNAYAVQNLNTDRWLQEGRVLAGRKIGVTSKAVQAQLGVLQPDYGMLFVDMAYGDAEEIPVSRLIQPKIEGEIAFYLKKNLDSEKLTMAEVLAAIDYAVAAIEIVDSRIADWKISIVDTIADNASSGLYVLGSVAVKLDAFDHRLCGMVIEHRGEPVSVGAGLACLGNPITSCLWLARKMVEVGRPLKAGDLVLSGALGPVVTVKPGQTYVLKINGLGSVSTTFAAA
jgi:2-keto-4-pentenoate hydratase